MLNQSSNSPPIIPSLNTLRTETAKYIYKVIVAKNIPDTGYQIFVDNLYANLYRACYKNSDYSSTIFCTVNDINDKNSAVLISIV